MNETTPFSRDAMAEREANALRSEDSASRLNGASRIPLKGTIPCVEI
jgi:hypothetical protein